MNKKSPRRMPLSLSAEVLDHKESLARSENKRVRNRLHINKKMLTGHESTNVSSMDYEMRRLKHELRGIKQTSGYFILNNDAGEDNTKVRHNIRTKRRNKGKVAKKRQSVTISNDFKYDINEDSDDAKNTSKKLSLPVLPTISSASSDSSPRNSSNDHTKMSNQLHIKLPDNSPEGELTLDTRTSKSNRSNKNVSNTTSELKTSVETEAVSKDDHNEKNITTDSKELTRAATLLGVNVGAARNRIQNRLAGNTESTFQVEDNDDLTPYMHVPPDGLPRTSYLLPPMEELFTEAKKARYIRKLRKRDTVLDQDDPERELNIDEIFDKIR